MTDTYPTDEGISALQAAHQKMIAFHDWLLEEPLMAVLEPTRRHETLETLGRLSWTVEEQLYRALFKQPTNPKPGDLWYYNNGDNGCQMGTWHVFTIGRWHEISFAAGHWPELPQALAPATPLEQHTSAAARDADQEAEMILFGCRSVSKL